MAAGGHDGDEMMFEFALISPLFTLRRPPEAPAPLFTNLYYG